MRAGVWRFSLFRRNQTQENGERFATGLRNMVALDINRRDGRLYGVQQGRDQLFENWPQLYTREKDAVPFRRVRPNPPRPRPRMVVLLSRPRAGQGARAGVRQRRNGGTLCRRERAAHRAARALGAAVHVVLHRPAVPREVPQRRARGQPWLALRSRVAAGGIRLQRGLHPVPRQRSRRSVRDGCRRVCGSGPPSGRGPASGRGPGRRPRTVRSTSRTTRAGGSGA